MKETILITGASGFIGYHLCKFYEDKYQIIALSRKKPIINCIWFKFLGVSVKDLERIFILYHPKYIIHCAGIAHEDEPLSRKKLKEIKEINTIYTLTLSELCAKYLTKRIIYISTLGVYGDDQVRPRHITEKSIYNPCNTYSLTKLESERYLKNNLLNSNTTFTILRPPLVYGQNAPGNISSLIRLIDLGIPLPFGQVKNRKSFISINNLVSAVNTCLNSKMSENKSYLIADQELISTRDLIYRIAKARKKNIMLFSIPNLFITIFKHLPLIGKKVRILTTDLMVDTSLFVDELKWSQPFDQISEMSDSFSIKN